MGYKYFRTNCVLRIILLGLIIFAFMYVLLTTDLYATTVILGLIIVLQTYSIIHYIEKTNRELARFLDTIKYSDFSQNFSGQSKNPSFKSLHSAFTDVINEFQSTRSEKEEQYRYLRTVIQHIGLGLLSYDEEGNVDLINNAAKRLFGVPTLHNIKSLNELSPKLVETLFRLNPGEKALVSIEKEDETLRLSIHATGFKLRNSSITLVSIQNIESELAEQEMEAWQKLIRILTHEIMNSVTPITSLASTANEMIESWGAVPERENVRIDIEDVADVHVALSTIERRSQGLVHFIEAYRNLTRIPSPSFQLFTVNELLNRIAELYEPQIKEAEIDFKFRADPENMELLADRELVEQVLINIVLNAIQALKNTDKPTIALSSFLDDHGRVVITVEDNGPGIEQSVLKKVFTPFFTTKKDGSGIGLSLSRQIMRLHKGTISVHSKPNESTIFRLRF